MTLITFLKKSIKVTDRISFYFNFLFIILVKIYKIYLSPTLPATCRFTPTCSTYAIQAFRKYPFLKAFFLSSRRISKCHPYHPGGHDPLN